MALKEDDAGDKLVRVLHLFNRFRSLLFGKKRVTPVLQKAIMKPVLVYRTEFEVKGFVKPLDDFCVAFQDPLSCFLHGIV